MTTPPGQRSRRSKSPHADEPAVHWVNRHANSFKSVGSQQRAGSGVTEHYQRNSLLAVDTNPGMGDITLDHPPIGSFEFKTKLGSDAEAVKDVPADPRVSGACVGECLYVLPAATTRVADLNPYAKRSHALMLTVLREVRQFSGMTHLGQTTDTEHNLFRNNRTLSPRGE